MIDNRIITRVYADNTVKTQIIGKVVAFNDQTNVFTVVSPNPLNTVVMVNFTPFESRNATLTRFVIPTDKKGKDIVPDDLEVADWNVWEYPMDEVLVSFVSTYRANRMGYVVAFFDRRTSLNAVNYKGTFTQSSDIPLTGNVVGDFYVCKQYNVTVNSVVYTYDDNIVWNGTAWYKDKTVKVKGATPTQMLSVDPSMVTNPPQVDEQDIIDIISTWGQAFIENLLLAQRVTDLEVETARLDDEIIRVEQKVDAHLEDVDNPHGVTAEQIDTYVKTTIDNKDANTLQEAKDYTYSQVEIDNKDTDIMNKANDLENANMLKDVNYNNANGVLTFTRYDDTTKTIDLALELLGEIVKKKVEDIEDGTTVVKKAEQDEDGNNIKDTYATVTYVDGKISGVFRPNGNWNANTNTPTLANNEPTNAGKVYYVTNAGTQFGLTFAVGDKLAFIEGGVATKWDNVDDVTSVNGKVGTVVINAEDIPFDGSGTNYLTAKTEVEGALKELDTRVKNNTDNVALKVNTTDIVDDLVSTDVDKPLSAKQGKVLKDYVDTTVGNIDAILDSILGV